MLVPPVLVGAILIGCLAYLIFNHRLSRTTLMERSLPLIVRLLFLLYPLIANVAFEAFSCYEFDNGTISYLVTDVSVACSTPDAPSAEHDLVTAVAWLAIALYPIGLIVLNGALLLCARTAILKKKPTPLSRAIAFLHHEYEPWAFWLSLIHI